MLFNKDNARVEKLVNQALEADEFKTLGARNVINLEIVRREALRRIPQIWDAVATDIRELDSLLGQLKVAEKMRDENGPRGPGTTGVNTFISLYLVVLVIGVGVAWYFIGRAQLWQWVKSPVGLNWAAIAAIALFAAFLVRSRKSRRANEARERHLADVEEKHGPKRLKGEVAARERALDEALLDRGIKTELREIVKDNTVPSYGFKLSIPSAPGLAEVFDNAYEITTSTKSRLLQLFESMPGGSIGIAGPRGVGKSTLIASVCNSAVTTIRGRQLFSVVTSAPVKYDARDFILHVFSSLCQAVLRIDPSKVSSSPTFEAGSTHSTEIRRWSNWAIRLGFFLGTVLMTLAFVIALLQANDPPTAPTAGQPTPTKVVNLLFGAPGMTAGTFMVGGIYCLLIAAAVMLTRSSRLSMFHDDEDDDMAARARRRMLEPAAEEGVTKQLAEMARDILAEIRFQRVYTSGWTGALKFPVGLESNINRSRNWTERQRSVPELVAMFRRFVKFVADTHAIVIGIDELDKLENHEAAQQFLNEIKAIFNLDHCYYVVSVSENAINNFERRGLPFRDAFDSAFDTILYVDYLSLDDAKRLIQRRVIGLEVPFLDLCYCLSGGLPRDLIRMCREMLAQAASVAAPDLDAVCAATVLADVRAKLRVMAETIALVHVEHGTTQALANIRKIEQAARDRSLFLAARTTIPRPDGVNNHEKGEGQGRLSRLQWEAYAYLYFCATVLEFFDGGLNQLLLQASENNGALERLCRVRQQFALNTQIAVAELDLIRAGWNFEVDAAVNLPKGDPVATGGI